MCMCLYGVFAPRGVVGCASRRVQRRRLVSVRSPTLWNNLPADIRQTRSLQVLKAISIFLKLKTHLFTGAYGSSVASVMPCFKCMLSSMPLLCL